MPSIVFGIGNRQRDVSLSARVAQSDVYVSEIQI